MKAPIPKAPLAHSLGSASIIAHTIHQKFNLKVPNYRQEEDWAKMGLPITRKEISNWHIKTSQYYLEPLYNLLRERLLTQPLLHADETSYRVLESDSHLTYYWTFLSGKSEKQGITLYHHDQRRSGSVVQEFLGDYSGYVHCDMLRQ
ncbi:transposase%2C ISSmi4 [Streptococcus pneumoniae]|uniref:Transposase, ISSmi4 n=1 Tax=Streptococcus pneumoniae TaxID=1313 RepID=A0AA86Y6N6_STREE|nr:transposase%2C ISSmi4 [Streptococcus pneumoniae]CIY94988.1 transposase%2C ISSmi4 [Streptococcus pneumoniae]